MKKKYIISGAIILTILSFLTFFLIVKNNLEYQEDINSYGILFFSVSIISFLIVIILLKYKNAKK